MISPENQASRTQEGESLNQQEKKELRFQDIHSTAIIGDGTKVYNFVYIGEYVEIGENCLIANFVHIDHDVKIGPNSKIMCMVHIPEYTKIGSNCVIYPNTCLSNEKYPPTGKKVDLIIEDNCVVGSGSIINAGVRLGEGCVVGAGSLVTKNVAPRTVVFGHPAHRQYSREDYDRKQKEFLSRIPK
jgi:acetyltransferase-like isoleucine patch superfamily enzyme